MEPDPRQLGAAQQWLQLTSRDMSAPEGITAGVSEDQVIAGDAMANGEQLLGLPDAVRAEYLERRISQVDRAPACDGLRIAEPPLGAHPDQCVMNRDATRRPVEVAPAQRQQLPLPHPGSDSQDEERLERVTAHCFECLLY